MRGLENERRDDQQKDAAHEVRAPAQGEPGAQQATRNIAHRDERGILPHDVAFTGEHQQGRKIAGHVDHFGAGRGMEKIKTKATDKQENQEIARARPEKSIVKTDQQAAANRQSPLGAAAQVRGMVMSQILALEGVEQYGQQNERQSLPKISRLDLCDEPGAAKRADKRCKGGGRHSGPRGLNPAHIRPH